MERGIDAYTELKRAQHDAKGQIVRHGMTYSASHPEGQPWVILRSKAGRLNQVDVHTGGMLVKTCGLRLVERGMVWANL